MADEAGTSRVDQAGDSQICGRGCAPCSALLPHYDFWLWNVLEVLARLVLIYGCLVYILVCLYFSGDSRKNDIIVAYLLIINFAVLAIALVIRHGPLVGNGISITVAFALVSEATRFVLKGEHAGAIHVVALPIIAAISVEFWLKPVRKVLLRPTVAEGGTSDGGRVAAKGLDVEAPAADQPYRKMVTDE
jgi:hypothetical protein